MNLRCGCVCVWGGVRREGSGRSSLKGATGNTFFRMQRGLGSMGLILGQQNYPQTGVPRPRLRKDTWCGRGAVGPPHLDVGEHGGRGEGRGRGAVPEPPWRGRRTRARRSTRTFCFETHLQNCCRSSLLLDSYFHGV